MGLRVGLANRAQRLLSEKSPKLRTRISGLQVSNHWNELFQTLEL